MAKQENVTEEVTGGLSTGITFGASRGAPVQLPALAEGP